jgi:hypothetical protein
LWLDTYDDIFSDFDPRPYAKRALSDDFLIVAKTASREKRDKELELNFLIPEKDRKPEIEEIIKKRLREHFKKHLHQFKEEIKRKQMHGLLFILIGAVTMFFASFIVLGEKGLLSSFLLVLFEPVGWFSMWRGLDIIFNINSNEKPNLDFYKKMSKADLKFNSY